MITKEMLYAWAGEDSLEFIIETFLEVINGEYLVEHIKGDIEQYWEEQE
jgi:hypothetical protein